MRFFSITAKLGNMRKESEFTIYPITNPDTIQIQSDKRIARVQLSTGKAILSDGKGGHPGAWKLQKQAGATLIDVPAEIVGQLREQVALMEARRVLDGCEPGTCRVT
jgi:hypothetical protein